MVGAVTKAPDNLLPSEEKYTIFFFASLTVTHNHHGDSVCLIADSL